MLSTVMPGTTFRCATACSAIEAMQPQREQSGSPPNWQRAVAVHQSEHAFDQRRAFAVHELPKGDGAAEVLVFVGVAARTAQRALLGDFDGH